MLFHDYIFIGLLSVLFLFKRTRYASFVYLVAYLFYWMISEHIPTNRYHVTSATINLLIFIALFKSYKPKKAEDLFDLHKYSINEKVGLLSLVLIFVNIVGYQRYEAGDVATVYNNDYRFIVATQIALLYIRNMIDAYIDRCDNKRALVCLNNNDSFEIFDEIYQQESEQEK